MIIKQNKTIRLLFTIDTPTHTDANPKNTDIINSSSSSSSGSSGSSGAGRGVVAVGEGWFSFYASSAAAAIITILLRLLLYSALLILTLILLLQL